VEASIKQLSADGDKAEVILQQKGLLEKVPPYYRHITIDGKSYETF
jgi:hypothetical protein